MDFHLMDSSHKTHYICKVMYRSTKQRCIYFKHMQSALQTNILSVNVPQLSEPGSLYIIGHIINIQNKTNTSQHTASHLHCVRRHTVVPSWQNTKCALLSHTLETAVSVSMCFNDTHLCTFSRMKDDEQQKSQHDK